MQPFKINYSTKNIPIPGKLQYMKKLVQQGEHFISRLRWKTLFIQNPTSKQQKETYGFKTTNSPPQIKELKNFEEDFFSLLKNVQFRPVNNTLQSEMKKDIAKIQESEDIIVSADKSRQKYRIPPQEYNKMVHDNITSQYRKDADNSILTTNSAAAAIAKKLDIEDRVDKFTESEAFITVKDHKINFPTKLQCRLINPAKSNIGRVSKEMLSNIVIHVQSATGSNQWRNTSNVINWFDELEAKPFLTFFKFDIVSFYPSITKKLFSDTIQWASQFYTFSEQELEVIQHARESYIFSNGQPWIKKAEENFDVTMGAFDGAELCELVGLYVLSKLENHINQKHIGLYRDDGLAVVNLPGPQVENLRKKIFKLFQTFGLSVTIEANIKSTEFLDVFLELETGIYRPFMKANNVPVYVHAQSNHPQTIKNQLPKMISKRLSNLSSSSEVFNSAAPPYQNALKQSGYAEQLQYSKEDQPQKRKRSRKILWFNPPYSQSVKTNLGAKFLFLIDKHFGKSNLKKYFNRKTVKVSYSCMPNMEAVISGHNRKVLCSSPEVGIPSITKKDCNCRGGVPSCPLQGKCLTQSVIYKADVTVDNKTSSYIGLASNTFKERYTNHISSFNNEKHRESTTLSKYIWENKDQGKNFQIRWSIISSQPAYSPNSGTCHLCLMEKTLILTSNHPNPLNKKSELMGKCRHRRKFLLSAFVT